MEGRGGRPEGGGTTIWGSLVGGWGGRGGVGGGDAGGGTAGSVRTNFALIYSYGKSVLRQVCWENYTNIYQRHLAEDVNITTETSSGGGL